MNETALLRAVNKAGRVGEGAMTPQALYYVVREYAAELGVTLAPHDLRRTFGKLAHRGGAALEQTIQSEAQGEIDQHRELDHGRAGVPAREPPEVGPGIAQACGSEEHPGQAHEVKGQEHPEPGSPPAPVPFAS